jgi:hypothetical protein
VGIARAQNHHPHLLRGRNAHAPVRVGKIVQSHGAKRHFSAGDFAHPTDRGTQG